jgi:hypothetical protein
MNSLAKEIEDVLERDGKKRSWMRVDGTCFIRLKSKSFKELLAEALIKLRSLLIHL